ncbi:DUF3817 domain-containing protein [Yinghuangia soli]|uniref:DUF3817 domain-containing protein n=1 Tax=Yinghuangia soli TaxID=2908204 RepID=A0AA41Q771_9ACTN|nr:DUF3817 domain-containing protein [Yinghuangia soli]MCF2528699.1 DUF3817 domain-containing protein [Yinghuangia soli]MCF2531432.1 DUF3817 domain-containing protein [Yinghuangia soli]
MLSNSVSRFRLVAILEGLSFPALLIFGSLLSRISDIDFLMMPLGMIHGVLFVAYILLALDMRTKLGWDGKKTAVALLWAIPPAGTFFFKAKIKDELDAAEQAETAAASAA